MRGLYVKVEEQNMRSILAQYIRWVMLEYDVAEAAHYESDSKKAFNVHIFLTQLSKKMMSEDSRAYQDFLRFVDRPS